MYRHDTRARWKALPIALFAMVIVLSLFFVVPLVNQINIHRQVRFKGDLSAVSMAPPRQSAEAASDIQASKIDPLEDSTQASVQADQATRRVVQPPLLTAPVLEPMMVSPEFKRAMVFEASDLDFAPMPVHRVVPEYPASLKQRGVEGNAFVEFRVDQKGRVSDVIVLETSEEEFGRSVVSAVLNWRFLPGTISGTPVRFKMRLPVRFRLNDDPNQKDRFTLATFD
jgi:TonB family protein